MKNAPHLLPDPSYVEMLNVDLSDNFLIPFFGCMVPAGFPSPADDYIELQISITDIVTNNPHSTYFVRVHGDSMQDAHIMDGSVLAVDRSLEAKSGDIIVAIVSNEFTVKRFIKRQGKGYLVPENKKYQALEITPEMDFEVWGKVVTVLHKL